MLSNSKKVSTTEDYVANSVTWLHTCQCYILAPSRWWCLTEIFMLTKMFEMD